MSVEVRYEPVNMEELLRLYSPEMARSLLHIYDQINIEEFQQAVVSARNRVPVRTGRLRDSIQILGWGPGWISAGATAPYARFVEWGTRYMRARPFWTPAVWEAVKRIQARIVDLTARIVEEAAG